MNQQLQDNMLTLCETLKSTYTNDELEEAEVIYNTIKNQIYDEINFSELSFFVIFADLIKIKSFSPKIYNFLEIFLLNLDAPLSDIGNILGIKKQSVAKKLYKLSSYFPWLKELLIFRRRQFERGKANNSEGKNKNIINHQLFFDF